MSFFNIILESFNIFTLIFFVPIGIALGIGLGLWLSKPKKNQVMKILPQDRRGYELDIIEENAMSIHCQPITKEMPPQRFMKFRPSFTILQKLRMGRTRKITKYLAREGTAYTQRLEEGHLKNKTLGETLQVLWGPENYNDVATNRPELIDSIEESRIGVTVQLEDDPLTPRDTTGHLLPVISEENIKTEEDRQASQTFWKGLNAALRQQAFQYLAFMGAGGLVTVLLLLFLGFIPVYQPPPPGG